MTDRIYFNSNAADALEMGRLNEEFYNEFIAEYGSSKMHKELWTGDSLHSLIQRMKKECTSIKDRADRKRAARLIKQYKALYKTLTN